MNKQRTMAPLPDVAEESKGKQLWKAGLLPFLKSVWGLLKSIYLWIYHFNRKWNEAWLVVLGIFAWKFSDVVLHFIDHTAVPLPVNDLMRFLYATIGTCIAHFMISLMLSISHPPIFQYLYGWFYKDMYEGTDTDLKSNSIKHDLKCLRLKYSLLVWLLYLGTWLVLAATY